MADSDPFDSMTASELLGEVQNLLGSGGRGETPLARLAERTLQRARETGDIVTQARVQYFRLIGQVRLLPQAEMLARVEEARVLCEALGVQRGIWLMDDLAAWTRVVHGQHV